MGGCRSGKSSHALKIANQTINSMESEGTENNVPDMETGVETVADQKNRSRKIFMATSIPTDQEMEKRVSKHIVERGDEWATAEVPIELPSQIKELSSSSNVILVDCLTLWVSNLMLNEFGEKGICKMTKQLQKALQEAPSPVILVSNEVGMGVVPENNLARHFRDMAGCVNQKIAQTADQVIYMVAGIPWTIKPGVPNIS